jgi:hypothetical protein
MGETETSPEGEEQQKIKFQIEIDRDVGQIGFIPQGKLTSDTESPPLADHYRVLVPEANSNLVENPQFAPFLNLLLHFTAKSAGDIDWVNSKTLKEHSGGSYGIQVNEFHFLGQSLSLRLIESGFFSDQEGRELLEQLSTTQIDMSSAWVSVPEPNADSFTGLWKGRVFGVEKELIDQLKYSWGVAARMPVFKFKYSEKPDFLPSSRNSETFSTFLLETAIPNLVENNAFVFAVEPYTPDWYKSGGKYDKDRKPVPLSEWEEKVGWPNATYAVDAAAKNWPSPIIVVDPEDSIRYTQLKYLKDWVSKFKGREADVALPTDEEFLALDKTNTDYVYGKLSEQWRKSEELTSQSMICTSLLMPSGQGISDEVVSGPNVSEYGLLIMLPEKTPLIYKKMFAHVIWKSSGLEALDYYTVGPGSRALLSFGVFQSDRHIQSPQDSHILKGFEEWVRDLQIVYRSPTEEDLKKVGMKTDYFSS